MGLKLIAAFLVTATMASAALAQGPSTEKLKAEVQKVFKIISSDSANVQAYCETIRLSYQVDQALQKNDADKAVGLSKKIDELNEKIGPEYLKLGQDLQNIDPNSPDGQEIGRTLDALDKVCN